MSLLFRDFVISACHPVRESGNLFHVFFCFGRKPQHEIELHFCPTAFKCLSGAGNDVFFCQSFVDDIAHTLGTCLGSECQTAFAHVLYLAHDIQRECIDTERRQGDIDSLVFKLVDQESDKLVQLRVITGA